MNILEIIAAKRTGQHAVISWIVRNLTDMILTLQNERGNIKIEFINENVLYWNDTNNDQEYGINMFKNSHLHNKLKNLIVNYEDVNNDYSFFSKNEKYSGPLSYNRFDDIKVDYGQRLILVRDFYNCLSSRYQQHIDGIYPHPYNVKFIELWKNNATFVLKNPKFSLKFEDWLNNTEKRKQILFDYFKINERYTPKDISGRKSSFNDSDVNNRFKKIELPEKTKELIRKDNELHYLIGALGYEYKEI
jgi:hypothetical protein